MMSSAKAPDGLEVQRVDVTSGAPSARPLDSLETDGGSGATEVRRCFCSK